MMLRTRRIPPALTDLLRTVQMQAHKQEAKANIDRSFSDAIDRVLLSAPGETVASGLTATASMLIRMNVSIFVTDDDAGFVTGDEPCSVIVPGQWNSYPTHPDVEIVLPLSPHHAALYSWKIPRMSYVTWDRKTVDSSPVNGFRAVMLPSASPNQVSTRFSAFSTERSLMPPDLSV
jgi:hypothetical protein